MGTEGELESPLWAKCPREARAMGHPGPPGLGWGEAGDRVPGLLPASLQRAMQEDCGTQVTEPQACLPKRPSCTVGLGAALRHGTRGL